MTISGCRSLQGQADEGGFGHLSLGDEAMRVSKLIILRSETVPTSPRTLTMSFFCRGGENESQDRCSIGHMFAEEVVLCVNAWQVPVRL